MRGVAANNMIKREAASILVVHDTTDDLGFLAQALATLGYDVRAARDGDLALARAHEESPDLILLYIAMPGGDANEVCRAIKADEHTRDIPVIFLSALDGAAEKAQAYAAGGVDYIVKPFQVDEVLSSVDTHLTLRRLQREIKKKEAQLARANRKLAHEIARHSQSSQALQRHTERLEIQHEIEQSILAARLPETIAVAAISRLGRLIPFKHAMVLAVGETGQLDMLASESHGGFASPADVSLYEEVLREEVLKRGLVQGVADLASLSRRSPLKEALYAVGIRSYAIIPLYIQEELIGTLHLESDQSQAFTPEHIAVAAEVAASLAVAIRQVRLYEQSQRENAERRRSERQLRQQKELLESTIESLSYPFCVINVADYTIEMANTAARALGHSSQAGQSSQAGRDSSPDRRAKVTTCYLLSHGRNLPCDGLEHPCPLEQVVRTGEPVAVEHIHLDANQAVRSVEVHGYPLFDSAGNVVRMIEYSLDITERRLAEQASREAAAAAERERLARELHDSVSQALFSATLVAEVLPQVWDRDPEGAMQGVAELGLLTRGALAEMRTLLLELRPAALVESELDELVQQLTTAVIGRVQILVTLDLEPIPSLPPDVHLTFYRVAQEALHNVAKHAKAGRVTVRLGAVPPYTPQQAGQWRGEVGLDIIDDGQGFDPHRAGPGQLGLGIMRERAEAAGATLVIASQPGQGTHVSLVYGLYSQPRDPRGR